MKKILSLFLLLVIIVFTGCGLNETFTIKEINLEMVKCPAGSFMMGSPDEELGKSFNNERLHRVTFTKPFYIGKYEVTQKQYEKIMEENPSISKDANKPVDTVTWSNAKAFCNKLNSKYSDLLPKGFKFDLPTEAQWEYACRAGTNTPFNNGTDKNIDEVAWYCNNASGTTHAVGQKKLNAWGIYDMHGNVLEWCRDSYEENYEKYMIDPEITKTDNRYYFKTANVLRGGCYLSRPIDCRSASRCQEEPDKKLVLDISKGLFDAYVFGFRVALVPVD